VNRSLALWQWTLTFVPFGLLLSAAMLAAETTQNLSLWRSIYSVRVAAVLAVAALALFPFRARSQGAYGLWLLFWTFSLLAYLAHLSISWFWIFGGDAAAVKEHQPNGVMESNLALTAVWFADVLLAWFVREADAKGTPRRGVIAFHWVAWLFTFVSFLVATLYFGKQRAIEVIGGVMAAAVAVALLARLVCALRARPRSPAVSRAQAGS
jgi:hypothetical protein